MRYEGERLYWLVWSLSARGVEHSWRVFKGRDCKAGIAAYGRKLCMPGVCPVATRSLGLNSLATLVNLRDRKYAGFSQSAFQQQCGCL